ncbi:programmed cell death 6-interacting protein-like isoform X2 [Liolophura sinensis]|uniref:programmed cell death 6-interacting protein-like isoform X2 n=1 Tax=Liolophura sinensis TaxID=3198878 RepID=UPI0031583988
MASYLAVPLKRTNEVDLVRPLRRFIENTYSSAQPDDYNNALSEFNKLRNSMMTKSVDKHESALEVLYRYYDQLVAIESKLPMAENQIRVQFKWRDAFDKESLFSGKRTLAISSGSYEKVCMLFNIGALQSQIASVQSLESDEGLKMSVKLFQQSAGVFGHLKDIVLSHIQQDPTPDMNPDTLNALSALMLAQAQESFFRKATADRMKEGVIAKVAGQCSDLYADAMKLMQLTSIRDLWPRDWISCVVMKQAAFHGLSEYYQSCVCKQSKSYGEEIARLKHAKELMQAAQNRGGNTFCFKTDIARIERCLEDAVKDNNFIYHDKIPDVKSLNPVGKAPVAKALPLNSTMSERFTDLFEKLVPLEVHNALMAFENRKAEIINLEVSRLRDATQLMNSILASLNLPASIEDLSGTKVPESLLEKAQKMKDEGGIQFLDKLMQELPSLLTRNREILDESWKMLDEEEASDKQLREQFKEKWTRTPSQNLTEPMRAEGNKYRGILDAATQADAIVQQKYATHKKAFDILSKPQSEIENCLPSANPTAAIQNTPCVQELRKLMEEVETIKAERDTIEHEIKEAKFDMSSKFLSALAEDGAINEESLSQDQLNSVYMPLREQVSSSLSRQEALLGKIQSNNTEFCKAKQSNQAAAEREKVLSELAAGYDMYMELKSNLMEGTKFYNDLTPLLVKFQSKVSDFCFARKTEKDELMSDLQKSIANQPAQAPPQTPQYQQTGSADQKAAPPRPPRISNTPSSSSQPATSTAGQSSSAPQRPVPTPRRAPPPRPTQPPTTQPAPTGAANPPSYGSTSQPQGGAASAPSAPQQQHQPHQPQQQNYNPYGAPDHSPGYPSQYGGGFPMPMPMGYNPYMNYTQPQNPYGQPPGYPGYGGMPPHGYPQPTGYPYPQAPGYPQQTPYPQQGYPQQQWR